MYHRHLQSTDTPKEVLEEIKLRPIGSDLKRMTVNSKGEQCSDICTEESSSEVICSDMCCWLMAVECCPNYIPPPEEEEGWKNLFDIIFPYNGGNEQNLSVMLTIGFLIMRRV